MNKVIKVAVIQMVSSDKVEENISMMCNLLDKAQQEGANWVVLPEYWPLMGDKDTAKLVIRESFTKGPLQNILSEKAHSLRMTIFAGSISLDCGDENRVYNSLLVFNSQGEIISRYDKQHLFGYIGAEECFQESDTIKAGTEVSSIQIDSFQVAQGICFDLRFPEFFYQQFPFDVLVLPAAFTYTTGKAHWEILLRARAIENQCYVLASAQGGQHCNGRKTFGHSMIIDPWGEIIAQIEFGAGIITADLDLAVIRNIRKKLPVIHDRIKTESNN